MFEEHSITVHLDGSAVKRVREEKRLTQLYVSKVVGVTTDTISRWENNRYPTIKRENAEKLAEALEVDVEAILSTRLSSDEAETSADIPVWRMLPTWAYGIILVVLAAVIYFFYPQTPGVAPVEITMVRTLPSYAAPGGKIPVRVSLTSPSPDGGFILRETFPKGWKLVQSSPPASSLDNVNGVARWIVKAGDTRKRIAYMLQVDPKSKVGGAGNFRGEVIVTNGNGQKNLPVDGMIQTTVAPVIWADSNGDNVIDDAEMLQASYTVDEMQGVHIDWSQLEKLWDAGKYEWSVSKRKFTSVR